MFILVLILDPPVWVVLEDEDENEDEDDTFSRFCFSSASAFGKF